MKRRNSTIAASLAAALIVSSLTACTRQEPETDDQTSSALYLNVCIASEPETMDPQLNSALDGGTMLNHMLEGLTKWVDDGDGNAVLTQGQAERWEKEGHEDGTVTYTFHLRDGIQWSDGKPVTADDFVFAWKRLVTPETGADYANMLDMVQNYPGL